MANLSDGVGEVVVLLEEVEGAERQQFEGDAHMAVVVEPVKHPHTQAGGGRKSGQTRMEGQTAAPRPSLKTLFRKEKQLKWPRTPGWTLAYISSYCVYSP